MYLLKMIPQKTIHQFRSTHSKSLLCPEQDPPQQQQPTIEGITFRGQIVRIRCRFSKLVFIDLRFPQPTTPTTSHPSCCCSCCSKITLVIKSDNLPSGTCTSYRKGKVKLGDKIQVTGNLVFAHVATGWVDISQIEQDQGRRLLEARVDVTSECITIEQFVGRGFEAEMPVHDCASCDESSGQALVKKKAVLEEQKQVCKFWINSGGKHCPLGGRCGFIHVPQDKVAEVRKVWLAERLAKRLENATLDWEDPTPMSQKAPHALRAEVFADWLLETFGGPEALSMGSGVYDIAGGGGQLSLDLIDRGVAKCTVVDSRPFKVGFGLKKWIKKQRRKHQSFKEGESITDETEENDIDNTDGADEEDAFEEHEDSCKVDIQHELEAGQPDTALLADLPFKYKQQYFTPDSVTDEIRAASLLVGLHPDQATGAIVETAIACNLPFAVIPCCVFRDDFIDRYLKNGNPVATTMDLVEWIKEKKSPGQVQTRFLNFQGKNLVVYFLGER